MLEWRRGVVVAAMAAAVGAAVPAAGQVFSETADVVVVEVPVQVLKDGQPVRGLTADDFEVLDGRKKQQITGFEVIDLRQVGTEAVVRRPLPKAARRHFLFLFDLSFSNPNSLLRAREAATKLVSEDLHPTDLAAVGTYSLQQGPRLLLNFTSDRDQTVAAIETLALPQLVEQTGDPLGLLITRPTSTQETIGATGGGAAGIDREALVQEHLEAMSLLNEGTARQVDRGRIVQFARSFDDLAGLMQGVNGRKHVLLLSEGFDLTAILGTEDIGATMRMNQAAEAGRYWEVDSTERFGTTEDTSVLTGMLDGFRRADATIQAIDVGGLRATGGADRNRAEDSLFLMANETGGEMYRGFNDLGEAMEQMLDRTSVTYVLAFQPTKVDFDGSYHPIKVKLKGGPSGARLVHRPGYYAAARYADRGALERRQSVADAIIGGQEGGRIDSSVLAAAFDAGGGPAYVPVLVEIDGADFLAGSSGPTVQAELYAYALSESGEVRDFFTQSMGLDLSKVEAGLRQGGLKYYGHLDLDPGEYVVRVMVRNSETGHFAMRAVDLTVPGEAPALSPPLVPEPMGRWLIVREPPEAVNRQVDYPFMLRGQPYIPAARPRIARGGAAELVVMAHNVAGGEVQLESWVLGPDDRRVEGHSLAIVERRPAAGGEELVARLEAGGLKPGRYTLVLSLGDGVSAAERSSIGFEVAG